MGNPFDGYVRRPRRRTDDELLALFAEAERRGVNVGQALALSTTPDEVADNIEARLAAEARPEVRELRTASFNERPASLGIRPPDIEAYRSLAPGGAPPQFRNALSGVGNLVGMNPAVAFMEAFLSPTRTALSAIGSEVLPFAGRKVGLDSPGQQTALSIAGGFAGAPEIPVAGVKLAGKGTGAVVRGGAKLAEEVGKTNVGNVLLPPAPKRVARPLIYEDIQSNERRLLRELGLSDADIRKDPEAARDLLYGPVDPDTGVRPGNLISAEDTKAITEIEQDVLGRQMLRDSMAETGQTTKPFGPGLDAQPGSMQDLLNRGLLSRVDRSSRDATFMRFDDKGLDEVFQGLPEAERNALPRVDATGRELNEVDRLLVGLEQLRKSKEAATGGSSALLRRRTDEILSKYLPKEEPEPPVIATQAGFGGELGPGQVARGNAEQVRMTQAPLSEVAASEADRIAAARRPAPPAVEPPPPPAESGFVDVGPGPDLGAQKLAAIRGRETGPQGAPRSVFNARPRYRDVEPVFGTDFDKAVYIVTNKGASARHPEILEWVQRVAPADFDIAGAGQAIRARLKAEYRPNRPLVLRGQLTGKTLEGTPDASPPLPYTEPLVTGRDIPRQQQPPNLLPGTREATATLGAPVPDAGLPTQGRFDPARTAPTLGDVPDAGPVPQQGRFGPPRSPIEPGGVPSAGPVPVQGRLGSSGREPPPTDTGRIGGPPNQPPPPQGTLSGLERPSIDGNIIGLREIKPGLTRGEQVEDALLGVGRKIRLPLQRNNEFGTAAIRERQRVAPVITSQATQRAHREASSIREAFDLEEDLFVPALEGKVSRVKGAPSIQDIQDFYPQYEPFLTDAQKAALAPVVKTHEQYTDLLNKVGIGFPSRASTRIGGGNYIARVAQGTVEQAKDVRGTPTRGLFAKAKKGFEEEIQFETAAEGRAAGVKYAGIEETLRFHYQQAGERATEQHLANFLTTATDDTNWPIHLPKRGELGRRAVDLPALADHSFPDAVANSINKVLVNQGTTIGSGRNTIEALRILNRGYRGVRATLDNSYMGIQALLSAYSHPIAAAKAAKLNFQAWGDRNVLTRFMNGFDQKAARTARLTSNDWVSKGGLHLGANTGEYTSEGLQRIPVFKQAGRAYGFTGDGLRLEVADSLLEQEMHGFRLFGVGPEIGKGRTLAEIEASGDLARIGEIVNNMTGVARSRFAGDVGDLALFAPRFFQSRLETIAKGLAGLRPGASLEQKIARRSLLKMVTIGTGLTVAINELNGEETDFRPIVNGRKNPNFMRVRALGRDWSLFGTWDSMVGLVIAAGHRDAQGMIRSQSSGIVTTAWDLLSGADFLGRSTRSNENIARYFLRQLTPFSGEQTAEGLTQAASGKPEDVAIGGLVAASTLAGAKSSPLSFTDHANEIAQAQHGTTWDSLREQRNRALEAAIANDKTTSPEYNRLDKIMDNIAEAVNEKYPQDAIPKRWTLSAKREELSRRLYKRAYKDLYPNQQVKINKTLKTKPKVANLTADFVPGRFNAGSNK